MQPAGNIEMRRGCDEEDRWEKVLEQLRNCLLDERMRSPLKQPLVSHKAATEIS
jgi:hypothetical protein